MTNFISKLCRSVRSASRAWKYDPSPEWRSLAHNPFYQEYKGLKENAISEFLIKWQNASKPLNEETRRSLPQVFQDTYSIIEDIYDPRRLARLGCSDSGDISEDTYANVSHVIVQTAVSVAVFKDLSSSYRKFKAVCGTRLCYQGDKPVFQFYMNDLSPPININGKMILYDVAEYTREVVDFLNSDVHLPGLPYSRSHILSSKETDARLKYISNNIRVLDGHWGGWHIISQPEIDRIEFDIEMKNAVVYYCIRHLHGEARYIKSGNMWEFVRAAIVSRE